MHLLSRSRIKLYSTEIMLALVVFTRATKGGLLLHVTQSRCVASGKISVENKLNIDTSQVMNIARVRADSVAHYFSKHL